MLNSSTNFWATLRSLRRSMSQPVTKVFKLERVVFSRKVMPKMRPWFFLSSVRRPIPFSMASWGDRIDTGRPSREMVPVSNESAPKIALATSVRPAPTSPVKPTISPARTVKPML